MQRIFKKGSKYFFFTALYMVQKKKKECIFAWFYKTCLFKVLEWTHLKQHWSFKPAALNAGPIERAFMQRAVSPGARPADRLRSASDWEKSGRYFSAPSRLLSVFACLTGTLLAVLSLFCSEILNTAFHVTFPIRIGNEHSESIKSCTVILTECLKRFIYY